MPARLSPEERERRRKERSKRTFSDANYRHYDPNKEGYGSAKDWTRTADARFGNTPVVAVDADLVLLGLTAMPASLNDLRAAYRKAARTAHPDSATGSHDAFLAVAEAFDRLSARIR